MDFVIRTEKISVMETKLKLQKNKMNSDFYKIIIFVLFFSTFFSPRVAEQKQIKKYVLISEGK
ncbi:hypothetical protein LEP1GSC127_3122, partial [Leptospira kirschneri str. 200801925]